MNATTLETVTAWQRVQRLGTVTYRQFDFWTRCGLILLDGNGTPGSGRQRHISDEELSVVAHMAHLVRIGVTPPKAAPLARQIAAQGWAVVDGARIEVGAA